MSYTEIARQKREERDRQLISKWLIPTEELPTGSNVLDFPKTRLSEEEIEITETSVPKIAAKVRSKIWTALQVAEAFCHRSQIAHQLTNCLSEIFYEDALKRAKYLDKYYSEHGKVMGRFHGIPISIKDNINIAGKATTLGFTAWCFDPPGGMRSNSAIADLLLREGAVFYCKTNTPTAMMMAETDNHVYGRTTNPYNRNLSAGGSSGGAAAHAALFGSCVDIGSDIGGSIRIPASFEGLYSLRPTSGRYPTYATRSGLPGLESVLSVNGPLCRSLESAEWYLQNILDSNPSSVDPKCAYKPWKPVDLPDHLVFAILVDDGYVRPTPPIRRGIEHLKKLVEEAGHEVIEWDPSEHVGLASSITQFFLSDGGKHVKEVLNATKEPFFPAMAGYAKAEEIGVSELWDLHSKRTELAASFVQKWEGSAQKTKSHRPIDAIIMPASPHPGCPHTKFGSWVGYTSFVNAMDFSAGTLPVGTVDRNLDHIDIDYVSRNESDRAVWESYDPELAHGAPISAQVVCRKYEDEKVMALLKKLSSLVESHL